jgi:hypothetical protein
MMGPKEHHHKKEMVMSDGKEILSPYASARVINLLLLMDISYIPKRTNRLKC